LQFSALPLMSDVVRSKIGFYSFNKWTMAPILKKSMLSVLFFSVFIAIPVASAPPVAQIDTIAGQRLETITIKRPDAKLCVVFENGSRATVDSWVQVIAALPPDVSVFAYNRPGYGNSQKTDTPRDGMTIVEELRRTLQQKQLSPPYVLVGHSLGGLYMQLFARRYKDEVAGMVLVDALYPRVIKKPENFPVWTRVARQLFFSATVNAEIDLIYQTGEEVARSAPIDDKPIVQLINRPTGPTAVAVDFGVIDDDPNTVAHAKALYPASKKIFVDSDHQMQRQSPVAVADAIKEVIASSGTRR
jgi:pimeloyl-ACP methyl ester carboxylesterase